VHDHGLMFTLNSLRLDAPDEWTIKRGSCSHVTIAERANPGFPPMGFTELPT
jgi:hypothetical protein